MQDGRLPQRNKINKAERNKRPWFTTCSTQATQPLCCCCEWVSQWYCLQQRRIHFSKQTIQNKFTVKTKIWDKARAVFRRDGWQLSFSALTNHHHYTTFWSQSQSCSLATLPLVETWHQMTKMWLYNMYIFFNQTCKHHFKQQLNGNWSTSEHLHDSKSDQFVLHLRAFFLESLTGRFQS